MNTGPKTQSPRPSRPAFSALRGLGLIASLLILTLLTCPAWGQDSDWSGVWDSHWSGGDSRMMLTQEGVSVTGTYLPGNGRLQGIVDGLELMGEWTDESGSGLFRIQMSKDGSTYFGHMGAGEWWSGKRLTREDEELEFKPDLSSPRSALRSFLIAANYVRDEKLAFIRPSLECLTPASPDVQILETRSGDLGMLLFDVLDQTTFRLTIIPANVDTTRITVTLVQAGTREKVDINFLQQDGAWRLVVPEMGELQAMYRHLSEARGDDLPNPRRHLDLSDPRSTLRTFLEEYDRWDEGGEENVLATLNMSKISNTLRDAEGPLLAAYLKQTIDRIGYVIYQEVPDDSHRTRPYVHFQHPNGDIVISPVKRDGITIWQFTPQTLTDIRGVYEALEDVPLASSLIPRTSRLTYFRLNRLVHKNAPQLRKVHWGLEYWQWLAILATMLFAVLIALAFEWGSRKFVMRRFQMHDIEFHQQLRLRLFLPLAITLAVGIGHLSATNIGLPVKLFPILQRVAVVLLTVGITWTAFNLANIFQAFFRGAAEKTVSYYDELLVSLLGSVAKMLIVIFGVAYLARGIGLPVTGVVTGLGVGGLAVAIAAKDTLANFLGSAVLLADRPFKRHDLVTVYGHEGYVQNVGLRSTQIRTRDDSIVSIPNNVLANEVINNLGRRRWRRVETRIGVTFDTPTEKLEAFAQGLRETILEQPKTVKEHISAGVFELGSSSIDFGIVCYLDVPTTKRERVERHRLIVDILRLAERLEVQVAYPTRTLHVEGLDIDAVNNGPGPEEAG